MEPHKRTELLGAVSLLYVATSMAISHFCYQNTFDIVFFYYICKVILGT